MLTSIQKYAHVVLALTLILPLAQVPADARPSGSPSFKSGFSSASKASKPSGGFGSFGSASGARQRSADSALSRKLDRERSEANALRTLDERRQAQAARDARPAPPPPQGYGYGPAPVPAQPPVIVRQDSGLGHVMAGAILAGAAANSHANTHANNNSGGGDLGTRAGADAVGTAAAGTAAASTAGGGSIFGATFWLLALALIGGAVYFAWKRVRSRRAANKPNYSFERN
jgi:hypothetical protein